MSGKVQWPGAMTGLGLILVAIAGGCAPEAVERSQKLQLAAMIQYRNEMAAYHEQMKTQLEEDKQREFDKALEASLRQGADAEGHVAVATAMEKIQKRHAKEAEFQVSLARLDRQFEERQAEIGRAIELAQETLGLIQDYSRLGSLIRSLFVKEAEASQILGNYENKGSVSHAGSGSQSEASGS
jgi:transcription initiation factor TFIIIB Brf1 subunit/transcription initiation factor TFIIB